MAVWLGIAIVAGLIFALIRIITAPSQYGQMSEEEFETDAQRKTLLGAAMTGLDKAIQGDRAERAAIVKQAIKKDETPSGDAP
jgi:hypothetical protein